MSASSNGHAIAVATRELAARWGETRQLWRDAQAVDFEKDHLAELFAAVERAGPIFESLDKVLKKVREDCE